MNMNMKMQYACPLISEFGRTFEHKIVQRLLACFLNTASLYYRR